MALNLTEVSVADIVAKEAMMARVRLDKATVKAYATAIKSGAIFPPVLIYRVNDELILVDGFHRFLAFQQLSTLSIFADVRIGSLDDALLAAVRADAHEGLERSPADKEKTVKMLLGSERWRGMSDREIAREANVDHKTVGKLRKVSIQLGTVPSSIAPILETRMGKDGKRRPATRAKIVMPPAKPPLPKFTREQLGAPAEGTENEQDPDSPLGVTRAQAYTAKHGHVHLRPLSEKQRADKEKIATSFVAALRELIKPSVELMKLNLEPDDLFATLQEMSSKSMLKKFEERMDLIEPLLTKLTMINSIRKRKVA